MYFCVSTVHCPKVIYVFNKQLFTLSEPDSQALQSLKSVTEDV